MVDPSLKWHAESVCESLGLDLDLAPYWYAWAPLTESGVKLVVDKTDTFRLNEKDLQRGLQTTLERHPGSLRDTLSGYADAETADVFLQCCLFGKVVFS